jgi:Photosystem II Psb31 protein
LNLDRRAAFGTIAGSAAAIVVAAPQFAFADGAVSKGTKDKARLVYGDRINSLKAAVDAGDFDAVAAEKSAFILFNSGTYSQAKDKPLKAKAIAGTNAIFSAIKSGDKAALKSAYASYVASNNIKALPAVSSDQGQGYSSDFDFRRNTKAGAIYVR